MNVLSDIEIKNAKKNRLPKQLFAQEIAFDHDRELMTVILKNGYTMVFSLYEFQGQRLKKSNSKAKGKLGIYCRGRWCSLGRY